MVTLADYTISKNHLTAIGRVASLWSYTELFLEKLIWLVLGIDNEAGYCVTTHLNSETRIHILESLAKKRLPIPGLQKDLAKRVADIRRLRAQRNTIVHALWIGGAAPSGYQIGKKGNRTVPRISKISAKGELKVTNTPWRSKRINDIAYEIDVLNSALIQLQKRIEESQRARQAIAAALIGHQAPDRTQSPKPTTLQALLGSAPPKGLFSQS